MYYVLCLYFVCFDITYDTHKLIFFILQEPIFVAMALRNTLMLTRLDLTSM